MKHFFRFMSVILVVVLFIPSFTAYAAEKRVITQQEYDEEVKKADEYGMPDEYGPQRENFASKSEYEEALQIWWDQIDKYNEHSMEYWEYKGRKLLYKKVLTYDGAYQENGAKIYTVMNAKTKKLKKTGKYSIIVGGTTVKKNEGTIKFVAPEDGKYRFALDTRTSIAASYDGIEIMPESNTKGYFKPRLLYHTVDKLTRNPNTTNIILVKEGSSCGFRRGGIMDGQRNSSSRTKACVGWLRMKKGQYLKLRCRSSEAGLKERYAYNIEGFDLTITKE